MKTIITTAWLVLLVGLTALSWQGMAADKAASFTQEELDQMMAPVALYPDSLLSQILMASTYPTQVAEAAAWSKKNPDQKGDAAVKAVEDKSWDPSVASLVAFPQVLDMMGDKPDWVKQMGDAFLDEPDKVMDTTQALRKKAKDEGNLKTTKEQKVVIDESQPEQTIIKIEPADPQVIYVPTYNPTVVYGPWWYPAYPPYYYRPPGYAFGSGLAAGIGFGIGIGITNAIWGGFHWNSHSVNINVNRYNNININNKINVNKKNVNWQHNSANRKAPRAGAGNRQQTGQKKLAGSDKRQDYRGRDAQREQARKTLDRKGMNPAAERKKLSGSGGDAVRSKVGQVDRQRAGGGTGKERPGNKAGNLAGSGKRNTPSEPRRSNNAFSGVGDGGRSRKGEQRGSSSNRSLQRSNSGGRSAGGGSRPAGGGNRSIGGGGARGARR